jgi:hypothetical protein
LKRNGTAPSALGVGPHFSALDLFAHRCRTDT